MTNFMIFLIVLFVLSLIILWLILDYHFIRFKKSVPLNIVVAGPLSNDDAEMLKNLISDHNAKIQLVDPCGYTQPFSE
ncbi:TPA: hypothetical protein JI046_12940 [Acinetobacter baumannii]|nr:hypothetical protein [Acinetobacter baumannii]